MTASFDLRPGGLYRVEVIPGHTARGEFVYLERLALAAAGGDPGTDPWQSGDMT